MEQLSGTAFLLELETLRVPVLGRPPRTICTPQKPIAVNSPLLVRLLSEFSTMVKLWNFPYQPHKKSSSIFIFHCPAGKVDKGSPPHFEIILTVGFEGSHARIKVLSVLLQVLKLLRK